MENLSRAIDVQEKAVQATPEDHPDMPLWLTNLGGSLRDRYLKQGSMEDLSRAIDVQEKGVQATPEDNPDLPMRLNDLGVSLGDQYLRQGSMEDLSRAIDVQEKAVKATPDDHPDLPIWLNNLGISLRDRHLRQGNIEDLSRAIDILEKAVQVTPEDHPDLPMWLNNLSISLRDRHLRQGSMEDLFRTIDVQEKAVKATPEDHPDLPMRLNNLGDFLRDSHLRQGSMEELSRAIDVQEKAVKATPEDHPDLTSLLSNLAATLMDQFRNTQSSTCYSTAMQYFSASLKVHSASPSSKFLSAVLWAENSNTQFEALQSYSHALQFFGESISFSLSINDRHFQLSNKAEKVRDAVQTACQSNQQEKGIEWLEQSQSVVWSQLLQNRYPQDELRQLYPKYANKLEEISRQLEHAVIHKSSLKENSEIPQSDVNNMTTKYSSLATERENLLLEIRRLPEFTRFMLPKEISELKQIVALGSLIVMINLSKKNCDALILSSSQSEIQHVSLTHFTYEKAHTLSVALFKILSDSNLGEGAARGIHFKHSTKSNVDMFFHNMLSQLWEEVVKPILNCVGLKVCITIFCICILANGI